MVGHVTRSIGLAKIILCQKEEKQSKRWEDKIQESTDFTFCIPQRAAENGQI